MDVKRTDYVFDFEERYHLDPNSPIPLYHQMQQIILERITKEDMLDKRLPPEGELMNIFGVSRATVKKTLDNLVRQGLLERRRGLGSKVISEPMTEDLGRLRGYTEEMERRSLEVRSEVLAVELVDPDETVRDSLKLAEGEQALRIQRLRGATEIFPVVLHETFFPASLGITLDEDFDGSLYKMLEEKYHVPVIYADELLSAGRATPDEARYLDLEPADPVMVLERVSYSANNRPVEHVRAVYRPDRYKFSIRLRR